MSGVELSRHNPFAVFEMYMRDIYPHFKEHNNLIVNAYYSGLIDRKQADKLIRVKTSARKIGERTADLLYLAGKTGREQDYKDNLDKLHNFYHRILLKATQEYKALKALINEKAYPEFGTNYVEFYHDGKGAVDKLISEAKYFKESGKKDEFKGQVAGAFYRKDLGDIDLVWGEAGGGKSDGWGLAKIAKYHPEILDKLDELIEKLPIIKESDNRYQLENESYKLAIRKGFNGEKRNWILTAFEKKDSIARRRTDLPSTQSEAKKTTLANANDETIAQNNPIKQNIPEAKQDTKEALEKNLSDEYLLKAFQDSERADLNLRDKLFEKERKLEELREDYNKKLAWREEIKKQTNTRILTRAVKAIKNKTGIKEFSKTYKGSSYTVKKINPRLMGDDFWEEADIIKFDDLKRFIRNKEHLKDFIDNKLPKLYYQYGIEFRYFKNLPQSKQLAIINPLKEALENYDKWAKELTDKEDKKIADFDLDTLNNLETELPKLKEQYEASKKQTNELKEQMLKQETWYAKLYKEHISAFNVFFMLRSNPDKSDRFIEKNSFYRPKEWRETIEQYLPQIKAYPEFGTNYVEFYHDGKGAVDKLISEAKYFKESGKKDEFKGQVAGAFYRKDLGDIDLVWGDSSYGLKHILEQRTKQWGEEKALKFIYHLSENIEKGQIVEAEKGRVAIKTDLTNIILDKKENNNFILTAFRDRNKK